MNIEGLLATLSTDRVLPWTTAAREFGLPSVPDALTRAALAAHGLVVTDFEAKRTAGAQNMERVLVVCITTDPDPTGYPWHTLVQFLGLAAGRRKLGVQPDPRFWDAHPHKNVKGDASKGQRFKAGVYGDGFWDEYGPDGHIRTWVLEYSSGEQPRNLIADKVRAYGRQPQFWFTDSPAHADTIKRAFREVLPGFKDLRVEVVCWPGDRTDGDDGRLSLAPRKEKVGASPAAPLTESTEPAVSVSPDVGTGQPLTLDAFLRAGHLLKPGEVAEALAVDVPRVGQMARELEALLGMKLERHGKDRRFTTAAVGVLRRAQTRAGMGVTFEVALRDELVTLGLVAAAGHDEAVQVGPPSAGEQAIGAVEHLVPTAAGLDARLAREKEREEHRTAASQKDRDEQRDLLRSQTLANKVMRELNEQSHELYLMRETQLNEIRKLTLQQRALRSDRRTFLWMLAAAVGAVLLVQCLSWLVSRLG